MRRWPAAVQLPLLACVLAACGSGMNKAEAAAETERVMNQTVEALHPDYRALPKGPQPQTQEGEACYNALTRDGSKIKVEHRYVVRGLNTQQITDLARRVEKFWDDDLGAYTKESQGFESGNPWITMEYKDLNLLLRVSIYVPKEVSITVVSDCIKPNGD
ncbi:hypothetical protein [Actinomadura sp. 6N118]|uniref:hypothetical protein n=1 Tax=Actinomadura sp. 6N118 TaxID=3375151 RepID=UPI0037901125